MALNQLFGPGAGAVAVMAAAMGVVTAVATAAVMAVVTAAAMAAAGGGSGYGFPSTYAASGASASMNGSSYGAGNNFNNNFGGMGACPGSMMGGGYGGAGGGRISSVRRIRRPSARECGRAPRPPLRSSPRARPRRPPRDKRRSPKFGRPRGSQPARQRADYPSRLRNSIRKCCASSRIWMFLRARFYSKPKSIPWISADPSPAEFPPSSSGSLAPTGACLATLSMLRVSRRRSPVRVAGGEEQGASGVPQPIRELKAAPGFCPSPA